VLKASTTYSGSAGVNLYILWFYFLVIILAISIKVPQLFIMFGALLLV
jgi:hypothetical protein